MGVELPMQRLGKFLLPDDDPMILAELERLKGVREKHKAKDTSNLDPAWPLKHRGAFAARGLRWGRVAPSATLAAAPWYQVQNAREKDVLLLAELDSVAMLDHSQSLGRTRDRKDVTADRVGTLLPGSRWWLMCKRRELIGIEALSLQGIPWQDKDFICGLDSPFLMDLAGNAFSSTVAEAMFQSQLAHMPFQPLSVEVEEVATHEG